jgi:hypothetical protein
VTDQERLDLADKIVRAQRRVEKLRRDLHAAEEDQRALYREFHRVRYGVAPGVRVRNAKSGYQAGTCVEVEVHLSFAERKPWIRVNLDNKDGTPGRRNVRFYEWELA